MLSFRTVLFFQLKIKLRDFPGGPVVKTSPGWGAIRFHMPCGQKTKT